MSLGTVTLTAAMDGTSRWITLSVTCTGMTEGTVYRVTSSGNVPVRGALNKAGSGAITAADYEAPQNTTLAYVAIVTDGALAATSSIVSVSGVIDRGGDVIFGLTNPLAWTIVNVVGIPEVKSATRQSIVQVVGRADPVIVSDVRPYPTGTLAIATLTDAERAAVNGLLATGQVIAFSPRHPAYGFDDIWYLSVGNANERRVSRLATRPERYFDLEFMRVAPPPADFVGPAFSTWQDYYDDSATWADMLTAGTTWLQAEVV